MGAKLAAAEKSGVKTVFIPKANWQESFASLKLEVVPVDADRRDFPEGYRSRAPAGWRYGIELSYIFAIFH